MSFKSKQQRAEKSNQNIEIWKKLSEAVTQAQKRYEANKATTFQKGRKLEQNVLVFVDQYLTTLNNTTKNTLHKLQIMIVIESKSQFGVKSLERTILLRFNVN